ncbi:MAG TPA: HIT family protein [Candidatus Nanoarchaeia archaeon]|nr:HIT family protein [Candidatus Nanoarchaeia archaeon]
MQDCLFCKIVDKEIPSKVVHEDKVSFAFLDIKPYNLGHTLVVPKKHYRWVWDIKEIGEFYTSVNKIANALKLGLKTDYIVSLVFGEEVNHAHVHLIPRFKDDGHGSAIKLGNFKNISEKEQGNAIKKIQRFL